MPRPPRRAAAQPWPEVTTPTRPSTNAITAAIPPFMLETPPHAPFLTTPVPPSNNPGPSIVPDTRAARNRHARAQAHQTPSNNGNISERAPDQSQVSTNALGSTISEPENIEEQSLLESVQHAVEDAKQLHGLREISSLATWTLSSAKPGCALAQLRHPSPTQFWQSDGPQPHTLTLHFFKLVAIVKIRIYLDFELDESYTPTKMKFFAGMSEGALVEFGSWEVQDTTDLITGEPSSSIENVRGWIDVPLQGVGGRESRHYGADSSFGNGGLSYDSDEDMMDDSDDMVGGDVLKAMIVQVQICENHQQGKDTHVRGFQVFSTDDTTTKRMRRGMAKSRMNDGYSEDEEDEQAEVVGLEPADWMGEPELR